MKNSMEIENGKYKLNIEQRITRVETIVDDIKTNHLVHMEEKIDKLTYLLVASLIGVVANLISNFIK